MPGYHVFKILLVSIEADEPSMQLAPFLLKSYLDKHTMFSPKSFSTDIRVFPYNNTSKAIAGAILKESPALVGFSCYMWNIEKTLKVIRLLKRELPDTVTILGGVEVSPRSEEILKKEECVDFIVRNEGEETFKCLVETILSKDDPIKVKGISFRKKGRIYSAPPRANISNLDSIPSPYLEGLIVKAAGSVPYIPCSGKVFAKPLFLGSFR